MLHDRGTTDIQGWEYCLCTLLALYKSVPCLYFGKEIKITSHFEPMGLSPPATYFYRWDIRKMKDISLDIMSTLLITTAIRLRFVRT